MSPATTRMALAGGIAGAAFVLALGAAALGQVGGADSTASVASVARASSESAVTPTPEPEAPAQAPVETAPPPTPAPATQAVPATKAPATTATTRKPTTTTVAPPAPAAPAPATTTPTTAKVRSGQRVAYTTAGVQAAITALKQRIPLFSPNDAQLRTFADAVCTSFDQGQTQAQVQATIQQAVSHIQGQSLSAADAEFMVRTVTQLRCPGYLP